MAFPLDQDDRIFDTRPCPRDANEMISLALDDELWASGLMPLVCQPLRIVEEIEEKARDYLWNSDATLGEAARWAVDWAIERYEDELWEW